MDLIRLENIKKIYGGPNGQVALGGVTLTIQEGEFAAIMGPSGSGKSTILAVVGGLAHPTSGKVFIDDIEIYNLPSERLADFRREYLGFVFQEHQLIPYLTAAENVMLPLTIADFPKRDHHRLAKEVLDRVHLNGKYERLPSQLSNGEQERVAIARAIVNQPPILLADEPTGSLDSHTRHEIIDLFKELNCDQGLTVVMVTHNPEDAGAACRVIDLHDGLLLKPAGNGEQLSSILRDRGPLTADRKRRTYRS